MLAHRKRKPRRGAAAVEFALVAPVFLIFVFGIIELGRLALARNVVASASREAVRYAVLDGADLEEVTRIAEEFAEGGSVSGVTVTVDPEVLDGPETLVTVTVSVAFSDVSWLPLPWILANGRLEASTTMRKETLDTTAY